MHLGQDTDIPVLPGASLVSTPSGSWPSKAITLYSYLFFFLFSFFCLFRAALMAYGGSQARGRIRATAASLHHSSRQHQILNPLSEVRDQSCILMDASQICFLCTTTGTPLYMVIFTDLLCVLFQIVVEYSGETGRRGWEGEQRE